MNEAKLHEFMGKVVTDMGGAWMMAMVLIGRRAGTLQGHGRRQGDDCGDARRALQLPSAFGARVARCPMPLRDTSRSLTAPTDCLRSKPWPSPTKTLRCSWRPVRVSSLRASWISTRCCKLSGAMARSPGARITIGCSTAWSSSSVLGTRRISQTAWLPALRRSGRQAHARAKVADVGCGHGASTIVMAKAYPNSRFVGIDFHKPSVEIAGKRAADAGVGGRVSFITAAAQTYTERDLI